MMAKSNLNSAQNSMKNRYDQNSVSRTFKPGDKVLALLPVPGRPPQARYFGPYIVDKKMSDLNYVLQTRDRRKQKQLCHINMLKPYYSRKCDNVKPVQTIVIVIVILMKILMYTLAQQSLIIQKF